MVAVDDVFLQAVGLVVSFAATFGAAALGSRWTARSLRGWYATLRKPAWTPSGRVIGTVWSVLYVLMALAAWIVWRDLGADAVLPLALFAVQLALNAGWSGTFFGLENLKGGFAVIVALWIAILATLVAFWTRAPLAGALLVPYLAWVTFAGGLNLILWRMNPRGPGTAKPSAQ
jgi:benzodiazapine receptor